MNRFETYEFICSILALDFREKNKDEILKTLEEDAVNWRRFFKTGSNHLVLQTLQSILKRHEISDALPDEVFQELNRIYSLNRERNALILDQILEINKILKDAGFLPLFLKGGSHLLNGLYPDPAERILADIDILVSEEELQPAVNTLLENGYEAPLKLSAEVNHIYKKHHPRIYKPGMPAFVEIHWEAVRPEYRKKFSAEKLLSAGVAARMYKECTTLSAEDAVIHNFIHSQLEHQGHKYARVYLRNLYDLLLLSKTFDAGEAFVNYGLYKSQSAAYLNLAESIFSTPLNFRKSAPAHSRLFLFRHKLNVRFITLSFMLQLLSRFYINFIKKFFLILGDPNIRKRSFRRLYSKEWYRTQSNSYRSIFGRKTK